MGVVIGVVVVNSSLLSRGCFPEDVVVVVVVDGNDGAVAVEVDNFADDTLCFFFPLSFSESAVSTSVVKFLFQCSITGIVDPSKYVYFVTKIRKIVNCSSVPVLTGTEI